ncbi:hypothetical protein, partial [Lyngbya confervoides]
QSDRALTSRRGRQTIPVPLARVRQLWSWKQTLSLELKNCKMPSESLDQPPKRIGCPSTSDKC